jgi:hypothetical protein
MMLKSSFVPFSFFVVVNNWTGDVREIVTAWKESLRELDSFYYGTGNFVFKYSSHFSGIKLILTLILFSGT